MKIDQSKIITAGDKAAQQQAAHVEAVKAETTRRISAVLDSATVSNIQGAAIVGKLTEEEKAIFAAGHDWVDAMRAACRQMAADPAADFTSDASWPDLPEGVAELAARF